MLHAHKLGQVVHVITVCLILSALAPGAVAVEVRMRTYTYKQVDDLEIKANVYRHDDTEVRPFVVWIHGGGWRGGQSDISLHSEWYDDGTSSAFPYGDTPLADSVSTCLSVDRCGQRCVA